MCWGGSAQIFSPTPCRDRCAGLLSACLIYASGQIWVKMKHPTRWLLLACCSFFFFIPFALSSFQSSAQRDCVCVSAAPHSGCVRARPRVCVCVYICAMRRDKRLHPPLRRRIPQRSATRSVWRPFHLSSPYCSLILLLLFLPLRALLLRSLSQV